HALYLASAADPRGLPAFPTRRSSDLGTWRPGSASSTTCPRPSPPRGRRSRCCPRTRRPPSAPTPSPSTRGCCSSGTTTARCPARSEEHTSELQSRENLVCRLLLEKKN